MSQGAVVFELCQANNSDSVREVRSGRPRRYPPTLSVPAICTVVDEDGDVQTIRYVANQKSIILEEQVFSEALKMRVEKPKFQNGFLAVPATRKNLIEFMRMHPWNEANQHWGLDRQRPVFRERNIVEVTRKRNENQKKEFNAMRVVFELDFDKKVVPIAKYLGYDVNRDATLIMHDIMTFAQNNPDKFLELTDNAIVDRYDMVTDALKFGIIKTTGDVISWADGRQIVKVPQTHNPTEYLSRISFDVNYEAVWTEISRQLGKLGTKQLPEEIVAAPEGMANEFQKLTSKELFEQAREYKVIGFSAPFFTFLNHKIKLKEDFYKKIEEDETLKNLIVAALVAVNQ